MNTNLQNNTSSRVPSLEVQDSNLKFNKSANISSTALMNGPQTGILKDSTYYKNFTNNLGNSTQFKETTYIANLARRGGE